MRIVVLSSPESWYLRDLVRAAGAIHEIQSVPHSRLSSHIGSAANLLFPVDGMELSDFDAVLVRSMPPGSLEQVVFRMDVLGRLQAQGIGVFNPPRALEMAIDKYLTSALIQSVGLPQPEICTCQSAEQALVEFAALGSDVVLKPLFGGEGRGIMRVNDPDLAFRAFRMLEQLGAVIYMQRFVPHHGYDLRLFVLGEQVWGMRRINDSDWRTNVSRGARTEPTEMSSELCEMARCAARAVGASIAGVDILPGLDGKFYVLEVNAVPGWRALSKTLNIDIAAHVLEFISAHVGQAHG